MFYIGGRVFNWSDLSVYRKSSGAGNQAGQDKAQMAFKLYDRDKDGYITKAEMVKLSKNLTKEQVEKVFLLLKI